MNDEFLTVSELNQYVKDVINAGFPQTLWVCGEIQGYDRNKTKNHIFFELIEKDENSEKILARIGAVIFSNRKESIQEILAKSENAFELKDDIEVKFAVQVDFYPPHGAVRLIIESIDPVYTLGKLAQQRQKLISKLKEKGTLEKNKNLNLPIVPLNIGLITAEDSAAYNDFISELKKSRFAFTVHFKSALMQGAKTEREICRALDILEKIKGLDSIVITRGGGSIADLSFFDSEKIAQRIALAKHPVLSGIGHEINLTVTDMAAHTFAKTPTAIARFLVNRVEDYLNTLEEKFAALLKMAITSIGDEKNRLRSSATLLHNATIQYLSFHQQKIIRLKEALKVRPALFLKDEIRNVTDQNNILKKTVRRRLESESQKLKHYTKMIDIVHPENTIKRGFSITRNLKGKAIKRILDVKKEEELVSEIYDGKITSTVKTIEKKGQY